ncbi:CrcB family protein [uncultured Limosilactobacillus sp.]|uniref:fluoride efflux transporter FluC n=1 Tax=uncultured Limosilactobacillus sp. TaxID=2837629 RepID=UPI0025EFAD89|nr:CrcB family protein [uncultured Limosilactobacillus sp.]
MLIVGIGASLGALVRYLMTISFKQLKLNWPLATLLINLSGSFLLGVLTHHLGSTQPSIAFWGSGVLGGYTTFSTFNTELVSLIDERRWTAFWLYLILSYAGGICTAFFGMTI